MGIPPLIDPPAVGATGPAGSGVRARCGPKRSAEATSPSRPLALESFVCAANTRKYSLARCTLAPASGKEWRPGDARLAAAHGGRKSSMIHLALAPRSSSAAHVRLVGVLVSVALASLVSGCTHVAPYDRGRLANPSMTGDLETVASTHVNAVQEGAAGGGSVAESGCGCN